MPALTPRHRHVVWGAGSLLTVQVSRQGLLTPAGVCGTCGTENRLFLGPHGDLGTPWAPRKWKAPRQPHSPALAPSSSSRCTRAAPHSSTCCLSACRVPLCCPPGCPLQEAFANAGSLLLDLVHLSQINLMSYVCISPRPCLVHCLRLRRHRG